MTQRFRLGVWHKTRDTMFPDRVLLYGGDAEHLYIFALPYGPAHSVPRAHFAAVYERDEAPTFV